jgi:uroporphyrinogen decarboxylase
MTHKERVMTALRHKQPDKIPYQVGFTVKAREKMVAYYGDARFEAGLGNALVGMGTAQANGWRELRPDVWEDEFGVQWDRSIDQDIGVVCNCRVDLNDLDAYTFPDPDDPSRYASFDRVIREHPDHFVLADLGFSFFERAWTLAGMEAILMAMVEAPDALHRLLDRILDYNCRIIRQACRHPIDAMMFGDDWGQQRGLIMGPELWREFLKPRLRVMYQLVKSHGKFVIIHSCGKVDAVFPDLIEIGLDVFNPFQPEVIDVYDAKRRYGDRLSFFGGVSTQRTLPFGTVKQVQEEVRRLLAEVGRDGGYICAPAHAIPGDAKPENIAAMIEVLQNQ